MEPRIIQILKDRHLAKWKDGDDTGACVCNYKVIFQNEKGEMRILSEMELEDLEAYNIDDLIDIYKRGEGFRPHNDSLSLDDFDKYLISLENIYGEGPANTFVGFLEDVETSGVEIDKELRKYLERVQKAISQIL